MSHSPPPRHFFPSSSHEFALPLSPTATSSPEDAAFNPLFLRFRRPSLLPRSPTFCADKRIHSPLSVSFTAPALGRQRSLTNEESESDRERMCTESSPSTSSGNPTPPIIIPSKEPERLESESNENASRPSTPPNRNMNVVAPEPLYSPATINTRRPMYPLKPVRILHILAESTRPDDDEVKSEAAFQRLIASCSDLQPRTPRALVNKGRYPEEAVDEEFLPGTSSDDDDDDDVDAIFAFDPSSEPATTKPCTPVQSVNGDEPALSSSGSPMVVAMDVDMTTLASPLVTSTPPSVQWRYTPPPTASAIRTNKRKLDDRYDPYPTAKRRAVSPSISHLRESHSSLSYPRTPNGRPSLPTPLAMPASNGGSTASSPTITNYGFSSLSGSRQVGLGPTSVSSSPILRPTLGLSSPILRPILRNRRGTDADERDVDGANEGVHGLTLS